VVDNQYLFGDKLLIPVGVDDGASSPLSAILPGVQAGAIISTE
jgi:hypothetical protein